MRFYWGAVLLTAFIPAAANPSTASLGAGGITLVTSTEVNINSEDLYVSPQMVRARYVFANDTGHDIETVVAFPLPDVDPSKKQDYAIAPDATGDFVDFKIAVDGKPITPTLERHALVGGRDVTQQLNSAGLNLVPVWSTDEIDRIAREMRDRLVSEGIVGLRDPKNSIYNSAIAYPKWLLRTIFHWQQRFPANSRTVLELSYKPLTGFWTTPFEDIEKDRAFKQEFCIPASIWKKLKGDDETNEVAAFHRTDYILKTANNWNGPIGQFHLTLDKLNHAMLMLCWDGPLKKTGPTTFEFTAENFTPTRDIHMLVIE